MYCPCLSRVTLCRWPVKRRHVFRAGEPYRHFSLPSNGESQRGEGKNATIGRPWWLQEQPRALFLFGVVPPTFNGWMRALGKRKFFGCQGCWPASVYAVCEYICRIYTPAFFSFFFFFLFERRGGWELRVCDLPSFPAFWTRYLCNSCHVCDDDIDV